MTKKGRPRRSAPDLCAGPTAGRPVYMVRQMDIILSNSSGKPIYEQITDQVKEQIMTGALAAGDALPSMRLLAKELRISVITTKRAYEELEKGGYVYTVPAKGSYVAQQSTQLVREAYLTQIEEHIQEILSLAAACGLGEEEVLDLFRLLWRDQDTEKGDTL